MAKLKKLGGRVVAMWKRELFATDKNDQEIAAAINARAKEEGFSYRVDVEKVQGWRAGSKKKARRKAKRKAQMTSANDFPHGANVAPTEAAIHQPRLKGLTTDKVLTIHGLVTEFGAGEVKKLVDGFSK